MLSANCDKTISEYLAASPANFSSALCELMKNEALKIIRTDGTWSVGSVLHSDIVGELVENIFKWLVDGDLEESLLKLEQLNDPAPICGRVFKPGEPTYSCRDCAMDATCVLCQQCFWRSEHSNHRYKMHTSGGGGCCDCGDPEAWHRFPACSIHVQDSPSSEIKEAHSRLPEKMQEKARCFFKTILEYLVDFLTKEKTGIADLPTALRPTVETSFFATVLYNDESHTFDFVIDILKRALKCDDSEAADFATVVDREGRSVVCIDNEQRCKAVGKIVSSKPTTMLPWRVSQPLKTLIVHQSILAHQELASSVNVVP